MSVKCLVIDGWHKAHTVTLASPTNVLRLIKMTTTTVDDCCDGEVVGMDRDAVKSYQLAGYSVDRSIAFYSTDGSMESIFARDWIVPRDKSYWETPITIGIHDRNAVVDYKTIKETTND